MCFFKQYSKHVFSTSRDTSTEYIIGDELLSGDKIRQIIGGRRTVVIIDELVAELHSACLANLFENINPSSVLHIEGGEKSKTLESLSKVLDFLAQDRIPKDGILVAIGGGTVCDVSNLAAQLFRRGLDFILIPTTLLAQLDAAVGGKNGLNFNNTKNLIGSFYHPQAVICDVQFLFTLKKREIVGGLAECIKVLAVSDASKFKRHFHEQQTDFSKKDISDIGLMVSDAIEMKLKMLAEDPFEFSSRRLLNYGHAFAHFFEERSDFLLSHGEAVLVGMALENAITQELGLAEEKEVVSLQELLRIHFTDDCRKYWLPFFQVQEDIGKLKEMRRGKMNLVCVKRIGESEIVDSVPNHVIENAWSRVENLIFSGKEIGCVVAKTRKNNLSRRSMFIQDSQEAWKFPA